jgi:hypothetical protein
MTLILNKVPALVNLAENPVIVKVLTDNLYSNPGVKAYIWLRFTAATINNDTFTLSWGDKEVVFTFKTFPNDSGNELQTYANLTSLRQNIVTQLQKNYILTNDFTIVIFSSGLGYFNLFIGANTEGDDYTLTLSDVSVTGMTTIINIPGEDKVVNPFYDILMQVFVAGVKVGEESAAPDSNLIAKFDIAEYIEAELSTGFSFPEAIASLFIERSNNVKSFYFKYAERYGDEPVVQALFKSNTYYALLGGISDYLIAKYNDLSSDWWSKFGYQQKFLTNQPIEKKIYKRQIEKLYYFNYLPATTEINLNIKLYFQDGTDTTYQKYTENVSSYKVYELVMTYNMLDIDGQIPSGQNLSKYDIWLTDQTGLIISETRTYIVENLPELFSNYFLFRNSLGGYDTLRTTGKKEKSIDTDSIYVEQVLDDDFSTIDREKKNTRGIRIEKYTCFTGWKKKEYIDYLQELLISEDVYEVFNNTIIPIVIDKKSIKLFKDDEAPYAFSFDYERAFISKHYDEETYIESSNKMGDFNDDFNDDFYN